MVCKMPGTPTPAREKKGAHILGKGNMGRQKQSLLEWENMHKF